MLKNVELHPNLHYLYNTPKTIKWKVIAPLNQDGSAGERELSYYESYDLVYDEKDLRIRGLDTPENLKQMRKKKT